MNRAPTNGPLSGPLYGPLNANKSRFCGASLGVWILRRCPLLEELFHPAWRRVLPGDQRDDGPDEADHRSSLRDSDRVAWLALPHVADKCPREVDGVVFPFRARWPVNAGLQARHRSPSAFIAAVSLLMLPLMRSICIGLERSWSGRSFHKVSARASAASSFSRRSRTSSARYRVSVAPAYASTAACGGGGSRWCSARIKIKTASSSSALSDRSHFAPGFWTFLLD